MLSSRMKKGILSITLSSLFYAFVIVITKAGLNSGLESSSFTFLTMVIVLLFIIPYYFSKKNEQITITDYQQFFILGITAAGLSHFLLFFGQNFTSAVNAGFLIKVTTIFTVVFAFFMVRERLRTIDFLAIAISFFGVFLLSSEARFIFQIGDLLIIFSALFLGFSNAFAKKLMSKHSSRTIVFWRTLFGLPLLFIFSLLISGDPFSSVGNLVIINGLFLALTIIFLYRTIDLIGASLASALFFISPLFSTVFAVVLLQETVSYIQLIGGAIILLGTYLLIRR